MKNTKLQIRKLARAGFNLIEMLVVIAVIGVIAAIAIPNIGSAQAAEKVAIATAHQPTSFTANAIDQQVDPVTGTHVLLTDTTTVAGSEKTDSYATTTAGTKNTATEHAQQATPPAATAAPNGNPTTSAATSVNPPVQ